MANLNQPTRFGAQIAQQLYGPEGIGGYAINPQQINSIIQQSAVQVNRRSAKSLNENLNMQFNDYIQNRMTNNELQSMGMGMMPTPSKRQNGANKSIERGAK